MSKGEHGFQTKPNQVNTNPSQLMKKESGLNSTFKRLTEAEFLDKRAKGLCFKCDGKFGPGHRCPNKSLQVMMVHEEGDDVEPEDEEEEHAHFDSLEVSLKSVSGLTPPHTMKIWAEIGGNKVVVLIDCGATHSFISKATAGRLGLESLGRRKVAVTLGNGRTDTSWGACKEVILNLPETEIIEDFFLLDLGGSDLILGMTWLQRLGDMVVKP